MSSDFKHKHVYFSYPRIFVSKIIEIYWSQFPGKKYFPKSIPRLQPLWLRARMDIYHFWNCSISRIILAQISILLVTYNTHIDTYATPKKDTYMLAGIPILPPQMEHAMLLAAPPRRWISDYTFGNDASAKKAYCTDARHFLHLFIAKCQLFKLLL